MIRVRGDGAGSSTCEERRVLELSQSNPGLGKEIHDSRSLQKYFLPSSIVFTTDQAKFCGAIPGNSFLLSTRLVRSPFEVMAQKVAVRTTFEPRQIIQPFYTGGGVSLSRDGRLLATCVGEDVVVTDLTSGTQLVRIEGVRMLPKNHGTVLEGLTY